MKQNSTLLLYIFLSLTSAAPIIPGRELCALHGLCKASSDRTLTTIISILHLKDSTPTSEPHFPKHQLSIEEVLTIPNSPPITKSQTAALEAELPLETSYLLTLTNTKDENLHASSVTKVSIENESSIKTGALPSAPTSVLPELRAEDMRKLELSLVHPPKLSTISKCHKHAQVSTETLEQEVPIAERSRGKERKLTGVIKQKELSVLRNKLQKTLLSSVYLTVTSQEINSYFTKLEKIFPTLSISTIHKTKIHSLLKKIASKKQLPHDDEYRLRERARALLGHYNRMVGAQSRREAVHGDVLVVGIVVLFVIAVVLAEVANMVISSLKYLFGIKSKGAIRIPDDDEALQVQKSFQLMPAPKGRKVVLEKIAEEV